MTCALSLEALAYDHHDGEEILPHCHNQAQLIHSLSGVMLVGAVLGMAHVQVPFVEPGILASVVALGLLVALAVDLPVTAGIAIIGLFALFHGHAHGTEVPENAGGFGYMIGFAAATAILHMIGIGMGLACGLRHRALTRAIGAVCAAIGAGLAFGAF